MYNAGDSIDCKSGIHFDWILDISIVSKDTSTWVRGHAHAYVVANIIIANKGHGSIITLSSQYASKATWAVLSYNKASSARG